LGFVNLDKYDSIAILVPSLVIPSSSANFTLDYALLGGFGRRNLVIQVSIKIETTDLTP